MVQYRRNKIPGGTYFFTVAIKNRNDNLLIRHVDLLKSSFKKVKSIHPYKTFAFVILPDHLHTIWQLPENDSNYSERWKKIKFHFSQSIIKSGEHYDKNKRNEYNIWQNRFWEHTIRDEHDLENHISYIHYNPVKHGLVERVRDWEFSSFHHYVEREIIDVDWGADKNFEWMGE